VERRASGGAGVRVRGRRARRRVPVQMSHDQKVTAFLRGGGAARGE